MSPSRRLWLSWLYCAALSTSIGVGNAAPEARATEVRPLSEVLSDEAAASYGAARLLFEDGDFAGALAKFRHAYALSKEPRLLWNMATCEKEQHHYSKAVRLIDAYLREGGAAMSATRRAEVETTRDALSAFVSPLQITGVTVAFTLYIDGEVTPYRRDLPATLDLGHHVLRIEAPGFEPFTSQVDAPGKQPVVVNVELKALEQTGRVRIEAAESNATILIDGRVVGTGRWEGPLSAGSHRVKVTSPTGTVHQQDLMVSAGASRTLHVSHEEEPAPLWPWLVGGAAVLIGGGIGGYLLLNEGDGANQRPSGSLGSFDLP